MGTESLTIVIKSKWNYDKRINNNCPKLSLFVFEFVETFNDDIINMNKWVSKDIYFA